jgi:4-hydroxymandelate synthase
MTDRHSGSSGEGADVLAGARLDHVEFAVRDVRAATASLVDAYGLSLLGEYSDPSCRSVALGHDGLRIVLTEGLADDHPASGYVARHGDGVIDIALRVDDARAAYDTALRRGAQRAVPPVERSGRVRASVVAFGDVVHSFVEYPPGQGWTMSVGGPPALPATSGPTGLIGMDHFAVCVATGELEPLIHHYESVLGFGKVFENRIEVGEQVMNSIVVRNPAGDVTFTILEPHPESSAGQIDDFVKDNDGAGVQHIALRTDDIVRTVGTLRERGVAFLPTPAAYYDQLPQRLDPVGHSVEELREFDILADADHDGMLFQIFARSVHPRRTYFFEVIERRGARTFGAGNIKALYRAIEAARTG